MSKQASDHRQGLTWFHWALLTGCALTGFYIMYNFASEKEAPEVRVYNWAAREFSGNPDRQTAMDAIQRVLTQYGLPHDEIHAADVIDLLVDLRKKEGSKEMDILTCLSAIPARRGREKSLASLQNDASNCTVEASKIPRGP